VRRLAREHRVTEGPAFDPEKRGTWQGSSRDLVVNPRQRRNGKGSASAQDLLGDVTAVLDTALSPDHDKKEIVTESILVGWDRGPDDSPLVIAVIPSYTRPNEAEAIEIATDYAVEMKWLRSKDTRSPDFVVEVTGRDVAARERFEDIQQGSFYSIDGSSYRDVHRDDDGDWWGSDYAQGSDYSGGTVTLNNYNQLLEMAKKSGCDCYETISSGHGGYHIFFNVYTTPDEIVEALAALDDYPSIDDKSLSELEQEQSEEAWNNWAESEFRKGLESKFTGDASEVSGEDLYACFHEAMEESNSYWQDQQGSGMWVDIKRVLAKVTEPPPGFVEE